MAAPVLVVGHKNPDNDSIAGAIGYAYLKNALAKLELEHNPAADVSLYIPVRLGPLPLETEHVLNAYGIDEPKLIENVTADTNVILVDHNECSQAVDGINDCTVCEIIDHHRIGDVSTVQPILFLNIPVGSTATIVTTLYRQSDIEIPKGIAALLLSAILTDTVIMKSPTTTDVDRAQVKYLSEVLELDPREFGTSLFQARMGNQELTPEKVCTTDSKEFVTSKGTVLIAQHETVTLNDVMEKEAELRQYLADLVKEKDYLCALLLVTDIIEEGSNFIVEGDHALVDGVFDIDSSEAVWMPGVLSRKKQVAAPIMSA